jgi:hypothetical protein
MRVGVTIFCQNYGDLNRNYGDWERYEVEEEGEAAPKRAVPSDCEIVSEEVDIARRLYSERLFKSDLRLEVARCEATANEVKAYNSMLR